MRRSKPITRDMDTLCTPPMNGRLPEQPLARFIVERVDQLDFHAGAASPFKRSQNHFETVNTFDRTMTDGCCPKRTGWTTRFTLPSIDCRLSLAAVYDKTEIQSETP